MLEAPGRILWYVSHSKGFSGSGSVRACSSLDQVAIGEAKELYRRYERLGIYEWKHVRQTAHGDPLGNVMAVVFSQTQLFHSPIALDALRKLLCRDMGTVPPLSTAVRIPERCFQAIYAAGHGPADPEGEPPA